MKNSAQILMVLFTLTLGVAVAAPATEPQPRLRLTTGEWAPFADITHDGFLDRVILEAIHRAGLEAEIVLLPNA